MDLPTLVSHSVEPLVLDGLPLDIVAIDGIAGESLVPAGSVKVGEDVLYFTSGSFLPGPLVKHLGVIDLLLTDLTVQTYRYFDVISTGLVVSLVKLEAFFPGITAVSTHLRADRLGVHKAHTVQEQVFFARMKGADPEPLSVGFYSVADGAQHLDLISDLLDEPIFITEKLCGWHFAATIIRVPDQPKSPVIRLSGESYDIPASDDHPFWRVLYDDRIDFFLYELLGMAPDDIQRITVRGEYIGPDVRKNSYLLPVPEVRFFEVEVNGEPVPPTEAFALFDTFAVKHVPVLSRSGQTLAGWLERRPLLDAAEGRSRLASVLRQGIVIRPINEASHPAVGRVIVGVNAREFAVKNR